MVQKIKQLRGTLFDDTPRGILEAFLVAGGITIALSAAPALLIALARVLWIIAIGAEARYRGRGRK